MPFLKVSLLALLLSGCTLYSNTDRENFNTSATVQPTASATCRLATGASVNDAAAKDRDPTIRVVCGQPPFDTTIVRVSR